MSYTVGLRDLIQDPYVTQELDRIAAALQAVDASIRGIGGGQSTRDAEAGLDTGKQVNTRPIADDGQLDNAIRWLKGPWLLNADGNVNGDAVLRPAQLTGDMNDYAPIGMDTCVGLELSSTQNVTLTGLKIAKVQRRILFILNRGDFTITLTDSSSASLAQHQFGFGTAGEALIIPTRRVLWLFYDTDALRWRLFALPGIAQSNLPASLQGASFPPEVDWVVVGVRNVTFFALGETAAPSVTGFPTTISTDIHGPAAGGFGGDLHLQPTATSHWRRGQNPNYTIFIRTTDVAAVRIFVLLTDTEPTNTDLPAGSYVGFRFSATTDSGWRGISSDGAAQTLTTDGTLGTVALNGYYKLNIALTDTGVTFTVNDTYTASLSATLPGSTTDLHWSLRLLASTNKTLHFFRLFLTAGSMTP